MPAAARCCICEEQSRALQPVLEWLDANVDEGRADRRRAPASIRIAIANRLR